MRAFVTGGNGFLGSHLVDRLLEAGSPVHVLIRKTSNLQWLLGKKIQCHYGDVREDLKGLEEGLQGVDVVFHVAGVIRARRRSTYYEVNAQGTQNVLEACLKVNPNIKRVVVVTSLAAHGPGTGLQPAHEEEECHPITDYGKSKRDAELITLRYQDRLPVTIIRPPAIYGPRDEQVFQFFRMIQKGLAFLPGQGKGILNLAHVQDVVSGLLLGAESPKAPGQIYYIGEDRNHQWREVVETISTFTRPGGRKPITLHAPTPLVYVAAALSEAVTLATGKLLPLNLAYAKNFTQPNWALDVTKAQKNLGYRSAYPLEKGVQETMEWYRQEGWL